jgi:hypothetical protein
MSQCVSMWHTCVASANEQELSCSQHWAQSCRPEQVWGLCPHHWALRHCQPIPSWGLADSMQGSRPREESPHCCDPKEVFPHSPQAYCNRSIAQSHPLCPSRPQCTTEQTPQVANTGLHWAPHPHTEVSASEIPYIAVTNVACKRNLDEVGGARLAWYHSSSC